MHWAGSWAKLIDVPSKTSDLINDSGFLTTHQDISGKEDKSNKVVTVGNSSSTTEYPSVNAMSRYVANAISGKADKASSLAGYGIDDAYTKTEINNKIGDIESLLAEV